MSFYEFGIHGNHFYYIIALGLTTLSRLKLLEMRHAETGAYDTSNRQGDTGQYYQ